jgi:hypothetical protein
MDEDFFMKLLELRKYLDAQSATFAYGRIHGKCMFY